MSSDLLGKAGTQTQLGQVAHPVCVCVCVCVCVHVSIP